VSWLYDKPAPGIEMASSIIKAPDARRPPVASVIISTYNWPQALHICLESYRRQDVGDFEIVVADDGSRPETDDLIAQHQAGFPVTIKHVWQRDEGYRLAAIRNKAIRAASGEYLIFTDGDCFVLPDFVRTHLSLREPGMFVSGRRSWLSRDISRKILAQGQAPSRTRLGWLGAGLTAACNRPLEFIPAPSRAPFRYAKADRYDRAQTCNLAVSRADCLAIGGFDERYVGHGLEDSDFVVRLLRAGVRRKLGSHGSVVLHLYHQRRTGRSESPNQALFSELLRTDRWISHAGLSGFPDVAWEAGRKGRASAQGSAQGLREDVG
jgi:glycosyltransferase involved in cell wall biosynthesis